jgi:ATP-dependent DNA ligase
MELAVSPPVAPMLARLERALPVDGFVYEPKWDGFRCLAFRHDEDVDLRSRNDRRLSRYFPELVEGFRRLPDDHLVVDGEIVVLTSDGFDFAALMSRLHPAASRVERLRRESPSSFVAFDLLARDDRDLTGRSFGERRRALEKALAGAEAPILLTPATEDLPTAGRWLDRLAGLGVDGVVAKRRDRPYRPGRRDMVKVKHERTAECVVAGARLFEIPMVASLLLGMYDPEGGLVHVGVVSSLPDAERAELAYDLAPLVVPLAGHPWERGFGLGHSPLGRLAGSAARWSPDMGLDWVPLRPERVCEVAYDQLDERRFRYPARLIRWRPDRDPRSCTLDQLEGSPPELLDLLAGP